MTGVKLWMAVSAACAGAALSMGTSGCSSSNSGSGSPDGGSDTSTATDAGTSTGDDAAEATCENAAGLDTYVANLTKAGANGLSFMLVSSDPAPPARGTNNWMLRITDKSGNDVVGATIDVKPFMPLHGHGSSVVPTVAPAPENAAGYLVNDLYLFMPGLWTITITAKVGTTTDSAVYTFCVAG